MKRARQLLRRRDRAAAKELLRGEQNELLVNELIYAQFGKLASVARTLDASERKLWSSRGGWRYTGGINGYNTAAYHLPGKDVTIIAFVTAQIEKPDPGVANAIVHDFTRILFSQNIAYPSPNSGVTQTK